MIIMMITDDGDDINEDGDDINEDNDEDEDDDKNKIKFCKDTCACI